MERLLVTGGAGFIGSNFVHHLVDHTDLQVTVLEYDVPAAADAPGDGTLTYRLDATPQGMVIPEAVSVTVRWPKGYDVSELPEGWVRSRRGVASYDVAALVTQPSFSITGSAAAASAP